MLLYSIFLGLAGLAVGSFLNVVIDRLPLRQSLMQPPSHCPACRRRLSVSDLIPVFSYLLLRGRCRTCNASIPMRILWVELATGVAFGLATWFLGLVPELAVVLFYFCVLLAIGVIDLEHGLILNALVYPAIIAAVAFSLAITLGDYKLSVVPEIASSAIGMGTGFVLFFLIAVLSRGGMGWGDVKMAAFMGAMLGFPSVIVAIFLAILSGGLSAVFLLVARLKGRKQTVPFGPFLAMGAFAALLWGQVIWDWYLRLFGLT
jgi:leader peptidase (prepilin peptidase)/N-methyltransferase